MNDPRVRVLVGLLAIGVIVALFNYTPARFSQNDGINWFTVYTAVFMVAAPARLV